MNDSRDGGCQCGAVRYRLSGEPLSLAVCHCTECQRQSGSAFGMSLAFPASRFRLLSGEPRTFSRPCDSGRTLDCVFCPDCGTRIYHQGRSSPESLSIKPGTLDDTSWLVPDSHYWTACMQSWVIVPKGVARYVDDD